MPLRKSTKTPKPATPGRQPADFSGAMTGFGSAAADRLAAGGVMRTSRFEAAISNEAFYGPVPAADPQAEVRRIATAPGRSIEVRRLPPQPGAHAGDWDAAALVEAMATIMVDAAAGFGACDERRLAAAGFSAAEIRALAQRAAERAGAGA